MQNCALQSLQLHIEVPLYGLPAERSADSLRPSQSRKKEINWQAIYYHWQRWNAAACFEQIRQQSIHLIQNELDCEQLNLDGFHAIAKKGGESFVYQHRKRAKTSNILPCSDILASTGIVAGNRYDAFNLKANLQTAFKLIKKLRIPIAGAFFNANSALDTRDACKVCFNHGLIPNIDKNKGKQKHIKPEHKRLFNKSIYNKRFSSERSFAWIDKFRALCVRDDRKDLNFLGGHHIVFALINLRHLFAY